MNIFPYPPFLLLPLPSTSHTHPMPAVVTTRTSSPFTRGSSDTVCSPCSARLLLHSWSGLEVSHYSGVPPPHHRLLPWPSGPAERLHGGLLWPPSRSRHGQVGVRGQALFVGRFWVWPGVRQNTEFSNLCPLTFRKFYEARTVSFLFRILLTCLL